MEENKNKVSLFKLFWIFFKINAITFGGGYTIVAALRDEFIIRQKLINEEEMLDLTALAQSGPGAMAINTSVLTGYKLRGPIGAIVCLLSSILPCLIIIIGIYFVYDEFRSNFYVNAALSGMSGMIAAILVVTTYDMGKNVLRKTPLFSGAIMVIAFIASYFLNINTGLIILFFGVLGLVLFSIVKEEDYK